MKNLVKVIKAALAQADDATKAAEKKEEVIKDEEMSDAPNSKKQKVENSV